MNVFQRIFRSESPKLERPLRAVAGYMLQRTGISERQTIYRNGYKVPFFTRSNVALTLFVKPDHPDAAETLVTRYVKPGDTIIDVGANIGCFTVAASIAAGPAGRVFAFEPHPLSYQYLEQMIEKNNLTNVRCFRLAAGKFNEAAILTNKHRKDDNNRIAATGSEGIQVTCIKLAEFLRENAITKVTFLKVDVEGFELDVLEGLGDDLAKVKCIHIEALDRLMNSYGKTRSQLLDFLEKQGFTCYEAFGDTSNIVGLSSRDVHEIDMADLKPI